MIRRSHMEVLFEVLGVILSWEHVQTRIMYRANINWGYLDECLNTLEEMGLVSCRWVPGYSHFHRENIRLTDRGLDLIRNVRENLKELGFTPKEIVWLGSV